MASSSGLAHTPMLPAQQPTHRFPPVPTQHPADQHPAEQHPADLRKRSVHIIGAQELPQLHLHRIRQRHACSRVQCTCTWVGFCGRAQQPRCPETQGRAQVVSAAAPSPPQPFSSAVSASMHGSPQPAAAPAGPLGSTSGMRCADCLRGMAASRRRRYVRLLLCTSNAAVLPSLERIVWAGESMWDGACRSGGSNGGSGSGSGEASAADPAGGWLSQYSPWLFQLA